MKTYTLNQDWYFKAQDQNQWHPAQIPGSVHTDLINDKQIPDPFYGTNEHDLQWIDKKNWEYKLEFQCTERDLQHHHGELVFEGLDTYAKVFLNEVEILDADNMFRTWRVQCMQNLVVGKNALLIKFTSPVEEDLPKLKELGYGLPAANDQSELGGLGDSKISVFARKAGYHYGWDWGPRFITMGIWRPVKLEFWNSFRINDVYIQQTFVTKENAELDIFVKVDKSEELNLDLSVQIDFNSETLFTDGVQLENGMDKIHCPIKIDNPNLWWSNGLGEAYLYKFEIKILQGETVIDSYSDRIGLRSIKLVQTPDDVGRGFAFYLNDIPVFAKGANYIPNDNLLSRVSAEKYDDIIQSAVDANMNMLRVWGGGVYEEDIFYQLCDEKGILVWQDFMFACSLYPGDESYIENVTHEVIDNILRIRNHACLALWCGNNEIDVAWSQFSEGGWGWKDLYTPEQQKKLWADYDNMFNKMIPELVNKHDPQTDYWPSSPMAGPGENAHYNSTSGDIHYWGVWHMDHPFSDFKKYVGRFMSEYGFQSFPDLETVKTYAAEDQWDINSKVMTSHQRSKTGGNERIYSYMKDHFKLPDSFESFLYLSQLVQAEGVKAAIEAHRQKMPYCMGSLYWQLNDSWPVASWASLDYYGKWKALHYYAQKAYESLHLSFDVEDENLTLFLISDLPHPVKGTLKLQAINFEGKVIWTDSKPITVSPATSTIVYQTNISTVASEQNIFNCYVNAEFESDDGQNIENHFFLKPARDLNLDKAEFNYTVEKANDLFEIKIRSSKLIKNAFIQFENFPGHFSCNYFDILPGKEYTIKFKLAQSVNKEPQKLKMICINNLY